MKSLKIERRFDLEKLNCYFGGLSTHYLDCLYCSISSVSLLQGNSLDAVVHVLAITQLVETNPILALLELNRLEREIIICLRTNLLRGAIAEVESQTS